MLTGEQAFGGVTAQVITRRLTEKPPRPREKNPAIPKPLDDLIVTTLGRTPQERFQTMEAVRDALLAAPAQAPATGPQRVVAWLGLQSRTADEQSEVASSPDAATGELAGTSSPSTRDASPVSSPATDTAGIHLEESDSGPFTSDTGPFTAESVTETFNPESVGQPVDGRDELGAWQDEETPRRTLPMRKVAVAAGAVILLITVSALVRGGGDADAAGNLAADTTSTIVDSIPAQPIAPDPALVAEIWSRLVLAEQQDYEEQFVDAIHTLQTADASVATILAQFPGYPEVQILADSVQAQIQGTLGRCTSLRDVNLRRNVTGPECPVIDPPAETDSIRATDPPAETDSIIATDSLPDPNERPPE
jgi:hypothetical protein